MGFSYFLPVRVKVGVGKQHPQAEVKFERGGVVMRCLVSPFSLSVYLPRMFGSMDASIARYKQEKQVQLVTVFDLYKSCLTSGGLHPCSLDVDLLCCPMRIHKDEEVSQQCALPRLQRSRKTESLYSYHRCFTRYPSFPPDIISFPPSPTSEDFVVSKMTSSHP